MNHIVTSEPKSGIMCVKKNPARSGSEQERVGLLAEGFALLTQLTPEQLAEIMEEMK